MNELRKEIERQFKEHGLLDDGEKQTKTKEETSEEQNQPIEEKTQTVVIVAAPKGYSPEFAEDFKNLPERWQSFLCKREHDCEKQLADFEKRILGYQALDDVFHKHEPRLNQCGISSMIDWISGLAYIDSEMCRNPARTLNALAKVFGAKLNFADQSDNGRLAVLTERIDDLEKYFSNLAYELKNEQNQRLIDLIRMFGKQTDAEGNLLHPYFDEVRDMVFELLQNGTAADVSDAYEKALWLNPSVRSDLIGQEIDMRAAEAQKAKEAAFAPKGKAEAPQRELTLREEIEKNMAAFMS